MVKNVLKSLATGIIPGFVVAFVFLFGEMIYYARRAAQSITEAPLSTDALLRQPRLAAVFAAVVIVVAAFCYGRLRHGRKIPLPFAAGNLCFLLVFGAFGVINAVAWAAGSGSATGAQMIEMLFSVIAEIAIFAFFAGYFGACLLVVFGGRFRSLPRLLLAATAVGAMMGAVVVCAFFSQVWGPPPLSQLAWFGAFGAVPGIVLALLLAFAFRSRLVAKTA